MIDLLFRRLPTTSGEEGHASAQHRQLRRHSDKARLAPRLKGGRKENIEIASETERRGRSSNASAS